MESCGGSGNTANFGIILRGPNSAGQSQSGLDYVFDDVWTSGIFAAIGFETNQSDFTFIGGQYKANGGTGGPSTTGNILGLADGAGLQDAIGAWIMGRSFLDGSIGADGIPGTIQTGGSIGNINIFGTDFEGTRQGYVIGRAYCPVRIRMPGGANLVPYPVISGGKVYPGAGCAGLFKGTAMAATGGVSSIEISRAQVHGCLQDVTNLLVLSGTTVPSGWRATGIDLTTDNNTGDPNTSYIANYGAGQTLATTNSTGSGGNTITDGRITPSLCPVGTVITGAGVASGSPVVATVAAGSCTVTGGTVTNASGLAFTFTTVNGAGLRGNWLNTAVDTGAPTNLARLSGITGSTIPYTATQGGVRDTSGLLERHDGSGNKQISTDGITWSTLLTATALPFTYADFCSAGGILPNTPTIAAGVITAGSNTNLHLDGCTGGLPLNTVVLVTGEGGGGGLGTTANGLYYVSQGGSGAAPWKLTRLAPLAQGTVLPAYLPSQPTLPLSNPITVQVRAGTANSGQMFFLPYSGQTVGTSALVFKQVTAV